VIQVTPQMRILVAIEPVDFRRGIDGLARVCRELLAADPFSGAAYVFRNRRGTAVKILVYDSQGFWLCHKRLSTGRFRCWPTARERGPAATVRAHELQVLLFGGDPSATRAAPIWRSVSPAA
jgi:transposase